MLTIDPKSTPVSQFHGYLLGAVGPRPIAFASTLNAQGIPNLAPFSFFNVFSAKPPIAIFSPARRVRDNTEKHTLHNAQVNREVVINMVSYNMVQQTSLASSEYADGINEFVKAGFTELASERVKPPRVAESPAQLECKVNDIVSLGPEGGAGNLIICEILLMHINEDVLDTNKQIDPHKIDLVARMGGNWYSRAFGDALFEVQKPGISVGIGLDQMPEDVRSSKILTGNELGQLGNVVQLPDETAVNDYKLTELSEIFLALESNPKALEHALHKRASLLLTQGKVEEAWKALLTFNN